MFSHSRRDWQVKVFFIFKFNYFYLKQHENFMKQNSQRGIGDQRVSRYHLEFLSPMWPAILCIAVDYFFLFPCENHPWALALKGVCISIMPCDFETDGFTNRGHRDQWSVRKIKVFLFVFFLFGLIKFQ